MIILLPFFPADEEKALLRRIVSDPQHFIHRSADLFDDPSGIRAFCPDEDTAALIRSLLPAAKISILEQNTFESRFLPRGSEACLRTLRGTDRQETVCVLNYRNLLLTEAGIRRAVEISGSGKSVTGISEPSDHPVQLLTGQVVTSLETCALFDPEYRLSQPPPKALQDFLHLQETNSKPLCTGPYPFNWTEKHLHRLRNLLFVLLRKKSFPCKSLLVPAKDLADFDPELFTVTGTYLCDSDTTARRCFFRSAEHLRAAGIKGCSFFGSATSPGLIATGDRTETVFHLRTDLFSSSEKLQVAHLFPDRGRVTEHDLPGSTEICRKTPFPGGPGYTSIRASVPCIKGTIGYLIATNNLSGNNANFSIPATAECEAWTQNWKERLPVNLQTGCTIYGRQDFPSVHTPCRALAAGPVEALLSMETRLKEGSVAGIRLSEAEALSVTDAVDLCRAEAFQNPTMDLEAVPVAPPVPTVESAPKTCCGQTKEAASHVAPPLDMPPEPFMDMGDFLIDPVVNNRDFLGNAHRINDTILSALRFAGMYRNQSVTSEKALLEEQAARATEAAGKQLELKNTEHALNGYAAALSLTPTASEPHKKIEILSRNSGLKERARSLLRKFNVHPASTGLKPELGFPFSMHHDGNNVLYACGLGNETHPARSCRIDLNRGTTELFTEGIKYASLIPSPDRSSIYALRFEGDMPFCSTLDILDLNGNLVESTDFSDPLHGGIESTFAGAFTPDGLWLNDCLDNRIILLDPVSLTVKNEVRRIGFRDLAQFRPHGRDLLIPLPSFHSICRLSPEGEMSFTQFESLVEPADIIHDAENDCLYCLQSCHPTRLRGHLCKMTPSYEPIFQANLNLGFPARGHLVRTPEHGKCLAILDSINGFRLMSLDPALPSGQHQS